MPTTVERTWRLQAFTDIAADPQIQFLREKVTTYEDGNVVHKPLPTVARRLSAVAGQAIPGGERVVRTLGELFDLVGEMGHALAAEDDAAAAAAVEAEAAAEETGS